ncbi:MAG: hypothetical protein A2W61_03595 [Deltaproteobacteria bacterium RIFCSPLOWO2_01_44_7]|nr:MAG: hypothetical protein A2712_08440 [Deltaproteobacteria bacterium RIFCSPHIGHO2_01_FULL_43_49]OGQ14634.1 MAG: hypothetical protein A3D22_08560 [Deltaproteobacteria bacterium RIFCSPHIGHO2_02_FULL_44_53]OGQ28020.1 MAG: hypothetical protein A3D98_07270 [Deltaproteobacteria bacterium RIFCSPHIGHO2_12_FULL_44_21]OGQ31232.1 MAG: hypothetical protein A2979_07320 [Deltaproteobacteria bacterium RIFCSPLOWO2_01_FULL_45_74]OGQ42695.1 MAG: hypothetical protein A2W61_03595 [Deltaproteobacteria bacterium 
MDQKKLVDLKDIVNRFVVELGKKGIQPERILLYGSHASGIADEWSDIDLVVISKDFEKIPSLERLTLLSRAAWPVQASIEALGYTPQEITERGKDSIIWEEIQKNYKVLYKAA